MKNLFRFFKRGNSAPISEVSLPQNSAASEAAAALELRARQIEAEGGEKAELSREFVERRDQARKFAQKSQQAKETFNWIVWAMEAVAAHFEETQRIGVWMKSDDCSDNRNRRRELREASSDIYAARQYLLKLQEFQELTLDEMERETLQKLESQFQELEAALDELSEQVTDTMGENPQWRYGVSKWQDHALNAQEIVNALAPQFAERATQAAQFAAATDEEFRAFLEAA